MAFDIDVFSQPVASILAKHAIRPLPLTRTNDCSRDDSLILRETSAASLFPGARDPAASVAGLLLLLGCWDESHNVSQDNPSAEGSYWHAIAHRIEPDSSNAGYWFRRVGQHPIFPELHRKASEILRASSNAAWRLKKAWDPFLFIEWCDEARQDAGSAKEHLAIAIQKAEWDLLFQWCAVEPV